MKQFIFTEEDRDEVLYLLNHHSVIGAKNYLRQLKDITSQSQKEQEGTQSATLPSESSSQEGNSLGTSEDASKQEAEQNKSATPSHNSKEEGGLKI